MRRDELVETVVETGWEAEECYSGFVWMCYQELSKRVWVKKSYYAAFIGSRIPGFSCLGVARCSCVCCNVSVRVSTAAKGTETGTDLSSGSSPSASLRRAALWVSVVNRRIRLWRILFSALVRGQSNPNLEGGIKNGSDVHCPHPQRRTLVLGAVHHAVRCGEWSAANSA